MRSGIRQKTIYFCGRYILNSIRLFLRQIKRVTIDPVRFIFLLGFWFFIACPVFSQNNNSTEKEIYEDIDRIFSDYYYTDLDSALQQFGLQAKKAEQHQLWSTYLEIVTSMAWCADHHKNMDTLQYFLQWGEAIAKQHHTALDTLDPDHIIRSDLIYTRGMYYYSSGDFEEAIATFRQIVMPEGEPIAVDSMLAFDVYSFIGHSYYRLENYKQSFSFHQIAAQWLPQHSDYFQNSNERTYQQALNQFYLGKCYLALATYGLDSTASDQAKALFQKSLAPLLDHTDQISNKNALISRLNSLAQVYENQHDYDSSLYFLNKSLAFHLPNDTELLNTYLYMGNVYLSKGNYQKAQEFYGKRAELVNQKFKGKHYQKAVSFYKKGEVLAQQQNYNEALANYQQAIKQLVADFNTDDILINPPLQAPGSEKELLEVLLLKAEALHSLYRQNPTETKFMTSAMDTYHTTVALVDKMRQKFSSIEYKQFLSAKALSIYEHGLQLAWEGYQETGEEKYFEEAFFMAEKNKSASLLEAVKNTDAKEFADIPKTLLAEENELKRKLAYWEKRLYEADADQEDVENVRKSIFALEQSLQKFVANLEKNYPDYYQLKYDNRVATAADMQNTIADNAALVSYFYGDSSLFVIGITAQQKVIHRYRLNEKFKIQFSGLIQDITQYDINQGNDQEQFLAFQNAGSFLYQQLLAPVLRNLKTQPKQLVIITDGPLGYLPFDVLLTKKVSTEGESVNYTSLPYLLRNYRIRYEYSATLLQGNQPKNTTDPPLAYAGFAPVYEESFLANASENRNIQGTLGNLVYNKEEVAFANDLFGGVSFEGKQATEDAFKQYAGESEILHLSMHAFTNDEHPEYSGMIFTSEDTNEDNFLYAYELYNMRLNAKLAILSACETGTGALARGEGIISLGRAFKYAGCPNVAMSLWKVNDKITGSIMQAFAQNLSDGFRKDEALRQAKLNYLSNPKNRLLAHPYFWASFVLVGNDAPLSAGSNFLVWFTSIACIFLFAGIFWFFRKKK